MAHFRVYARGLVHLSVCSDLPISEVLERANQEEPTGIESRWTLDPAGTFSDGIPNPARCTTDPDRRHYLLSC